MKKYCSLLLLSAVTTISLNSQAGDCSKEAVAVLKEKGIHATKLFWADKRGKENSLSYLFWFETEECGSSGYVNVTTNENCYVNEVFTRYRCRIPGFKHYW